MILLGEVRCRQEDEGGRAVQGESSLLREEEGEHSH